MRTPYSLLFWLLLTLLPAPLSASADPPQRRRIGLALSGGGARGFAHIGVLQWLEEHRIPVDYVAGTSMGAVIGGLYAMGISPAEIRLLVEESNWERMFSATPSYDLLTFRRKEDQRWNSMRIDMGLKGGLRVPAGLSSGHNFTLLLQRISLPYSGLASFDQLPVPFRSVTLDLEKGEIVVLDKGSLAEALRAAVAIPGILTPIEIDGRLLADGGVLNNLPTDIVQAMGANLIIAVSAGSPLLEKESLNSFLSVLDQAFTVAVIQTAQRNLQYADVVISPEMKEVAAGDFNQAVEIVEAGYQAASRSGLLLSALALEEAAWESYLEERRSRLRSEEPFVDLIEVSGAAGPQREAIVRKLEDHLGRPVSPDKLEREIDEIFGWGRFEQVTYHVRGAERPQELAVRVAEKTHGPPFLELGLLIDGAETDSVYFNARSRVTLLDVGGHGSEWRLDGAVGRHALLATEYYRPFYRGWFAEPRLFTGRRVVDLFEGDRSLSEYRLRESGAGFDLGYGFHRLTDQVRMGFEISSLRTSVRSGEVLLPLDAGTTQAASLRWEHDQLESITIPRSGFSSDLTGEWFFRSPGTDAGFPRARARFQGFLPAGESNILFLTAEAGTTFSRDAPLAQQFFLGGPFRMGALRPGEQRGSRFGLANAGLLHRTSRPAPFIGGTTYIGVWYESGTAFLRSGERDWTHNLSGGFVVDSILGPFLIGGSWGESARGRVYFRLGPLF